MSFELNEGGDFIDGNYETYKYGIRVLGVCHLVTSIVIHTPGHSIPGSSLWC